MVERSTGIAEVMGSIPVNPGFFQAFLRFFFIALITAMKLKTHKKNISKETALNYVSPDHRNSSNLHNVYLACFSSNILVKSLTTVICNNNVIIIIDCQNPEVHLSLKH